ncbi:hypothetical protein HYH03_017833 [Edaphochlamys debaryana]|uniref:FCP1 homology domain-containing protein n=1 Tax=Edaphochlamys debaryana TaxID=47281 RepID=A0A835XGH6_9CHLO|nr:hypothetical protein HYH03_017833 [Edaphochlamys debaryana]|eukprot:KAG2483286.1 hypothetical protein HYH03_017833 [Edaphochlamys debaryana]
MMAQPSCKASAPRRRVLLLDLEALLWAGLSPAACRELGAAPPGSGLEPNLVLHPPPPADVVAILSTAATPTGGPAPAAVARSVTKLVSYDLDTDDSDDDARDFCLLSSGASDRRLVEEDEECDLGPFSPPSSDHGHLRRNSSDRGSSSGSGSTVDRGPFGRRSVNPGHESDDDTAANDVMPANAAAAAAQVAAIDMPAVPRRRTSSGFEDWGFTPPSSAAASPDTKSWLPLTGLPLPPALQPPPPPALALPQSLALLAPQLSQGPIWALRPGARRFILSVQPFFEVVAFSHRGDAWLEAMRPLLDPHCQVLGLRASFSPSYAGDGSCGMPFSEVPSGPDASRPVPWAPWSPALRAAIAGPGPHGCADTDGPIVVTPASRDLFGCLAGSVVEVEPYSASYGPCDDVLGVLSAVLVKHLVVHTLVPTSPHGGSAAPRSVRPLPVPQVLQRLGMWPGPLRSTPAVLALRTHRLDRAATPAQPHPLGSISNSAGQAGSAGASSSAPVPVPQQARSPRRQQSTRYPAPCHLATIDEGDETTPEPPAPAASPLAAFGLLQAAAGSSPMAVHGVSLAVLLGHAAAKMKATTPASPKPIPQPAPRPGTVAAHLHASISTSASAPAQPSRLQHCSSSSSFRRLSSGEALSSHSCGSADSSGHGSACSGSSSGLASLCSTSSGSAPMSPAGVSLSGIQAFVDSLASSLPDGPATLPYTSTKDPRNTGPTPPGDAAPADPHDSDNASPFALSQWLPPPVPPRRTDNAEPAPLHPLLQRLAKRLALSAGPQAPAGPKAPGASPARSGSGSPSASNASSRSSTGSGCTSTASASDSAAEPAARSRDLRSAALRSERKAAQTGAGGEAGARKTGHESIWGGRGGAVRCGRGGLLGSLVRGGVAACFQGAGGPVDCRACGRVHRGRTTITGPSNDDEEPRAGLYDSDEDADGAVRLTLPYTSVSAPNVLLPTHAIALTLCTGAMQGACVTPPVPGVRHNGAWSPASA